MFAVDASIMTVKEKMHMYVPSTPAISYSSYQGNATRSRLKHENVKRKREKKKTICQNESLK